MIVSRVAFDRFVLELPPADASWRPLADPTCLGETAAWLWDYGPTPILALVGDVGGATAPWLAAWTPRRVRWNGATASAVLLASRADLERFLEVGAPHAVTTFLWPNVIAKTFEALNAGGDAWERAVDAHARIAEGARVEVVQHSPS